MHGRSLPFAALCFALGAFGCGASRDVEVSGTVMAPSRLEVGDKLVIDFIDVVGAGMDAERHLTRRAELLALGDFKQTVLLEGDQLLVRAVDDRDGNEVCSPGEAWAETFAPVNANKAEHVSLQLGNAECPER